MTDAEKARKYDEILAIYNAEGKTIQEFVREVVAIIDDVELPIRVSRI